MLVTLSAALPVLLSVTDCAALVVFSSWLPKLKFVADKLTMGAGAAPVPVRLMVCGLPAMLSVIVTAPVRDRKSTRLNSSHGYISYAVFCLKKKTYKINKRCDPPTVLTLVETS